MGMRCSSSNRRHNRSRRITECIKHAIGPGGRTLRRGRVQNAASRIRGHKASERHRQRSTQLHRHSLTSEASEARSRPRELAGERARDGGASGPGDELKQGLSIGA